MPIGAISTLPNIVTSVLRTSPKTVLDLGIGHGINGAAVRNWLDVGVQPYHTYVEGVEGFNYRSPLWGCYNVVHECTIEKFFETDVRKWDCILMTDVIEHFKKEEGLRIIAECKDRLNHRGSLVVVTPAKWIEQGAYLGNELETHKSLWSAEDFEKLGFVVLKDGKPDEFGYMMIAAEYFNA